MIELDKLIVPIVAGLFGFLPALLQWLSAQGAARGRNSRITLLSAELKFLEQWANLAQASQDKSATQQDGELARKIQKDLSHILDEYRSIREEEAKKAKTSEEVSFIRRALLLFRPSSGKGWFIHTTFYFVTFFVIGMIVSDYQNPTFDPETGENEFVYLLIGSFVIFAPIMFLLGRAGVRLRERELKHQAG